jgi:hypothetical protein
MNFDFIADPHPDPAFHSNMDPDPAFQNNEDRCGSGSVSTSLIKLQQGTFIKDYRQVLFEEDESMVGGTWYCSVPT